MISLLLGMAMLADSGAAAGQAGGRALAGCPATYKAAKALLRGSPHIVQGGRQSGDEAYATFSDYRQARPQILGVTATGILIHTPRDGDMSEVGRVVIRLPGQGRDAYLPAFVRVYGKDGSDGEARPDGDDKTGTLNEVRLEDDEGPFSVFTQGTAHLVCLYSYG